MKGIRSGLFAAALAWAGPALAQDNPELGDIGAEVDSSTESTFEATAPEPEVDSSGGGDGIDYSGSLRIGLDTVLLSFVSTTFTLDADEDIESSTTNLRIGIVTSDLGLNVGYAFVDQLVVGSRLQISTRSGTTDNGGVEEDTSEFAWLLQPYGEYVFTPGETLEWLALASLGVRGVSQDVGGTERNGFSFLMAIGGGAHIVLSHWASIDPLVELGYLLGSQSDAGVDYSQSALFVSVRAGLSIWL